MKLSKRLQQLEQMVVSDYDHIWDCCCDHGLLGSVLLARKAANQVHFVDIVPGLITDLAQKLEQFGSPSDWQTHCIDVAQLPLKQYQGNHLIIIAGVGGDLLIQFLEALRQNNPGLEADFLLCPVYHQYAVRQKLIELEYSLIDERLIVDNQRFYEALLVSSRSNANTPVSPVGEKIWQSGSAEQVETSRRYLAKTLSHYRRVQRADRHDVGPIVEAYARIVI